MKTLAIIPARGGSKRIPQKNIRPFLGIPIIEYGIRAAIKSEVFDEIMVSTDDQETSIIAKKAGATIPFLRTPENANDFATLTDVITEVILEYKNQGKEFDYVCCILATAPFVTAQKLNDAFTLIKNSNFDSVFPVIQFGFPIQRALRITDSKIQMIQEEHKFTRSQDLEKTYYDSGQFYWINTKAFLLNKSILTNNSGSIIVPETEAHDIDTFEDWKIAEIKYSLLKTNN